jgi:hypothetical protein
MTGILMMFLTPCRSHTSIKFTVWLHNSIKSTVIVMRSTEAAFMHCRCIELCILSGSTRDLQTWSWLDPSLDPRGDDHPMLQADTHDDVPSLT